MSVKIAEIPDFSIKIGEVNIGKKKKVNFEKSKKNK